MGIISTLLGNDVTTDVVDLLTEQHAQVDALFETIEEGGANAATAFMQLADMLAAHAAVEEQLFYPAVMMKDTESQLQEAVEEHLSVKRLLADMLALPVSSPQFVAKLTVLKEQVSHHAHKEEEAKLFPKVRAMLNRDERAGLGNEVLVMFEELMAASPRNHVPEETRTAAELPRPG